jgi:hypothetical protein
MYETPAPAYYPAPPGHRPPVPYLGAFRTLSLVHAGLVPITAGALWTWCGGLFYFLGPDFEPMGVTLTAMFSLYALQLGLKLAAALAAERAPVRAAWYLYGSLAVMAAQVAAMAYYFREATVFAMVPCLLEGIVIAELNVFAKYRRQLVPVPTMQGRPRRADQYTATAGAVAGVLVAVLVGSTYYGWLPDFDSTEADARIESALDETLVGIDSPPDHLTDQAEPKPCGPEGMLDEVLFKEFTTYYVFTGDDPLAFYEANEGAVRERWEALGYDVDAVADEGGMPAVEGVRSDGLRVVFSYGGHPEQAGRTVLAAYSGCVEYTG